MDWRSRRLLKVVLILVIIGASYFFYATEGIKQGLDLAGGAHIVLEAHDSDARKVDPEAMRGVINIIERRVNALGLAEAVVQQEGDRRIIVELPEVTNPNEAIKTIGTTAMLEFKNEAGEVLMTGEYLVKAEPAYNQFGQPVVSFELNDEGTKLFEKITREYRGRKIGIYLDNQLLTNPTVNDVITRRGEISGGYQTLDDASKHALLLREGALPVPVEIAEVRTIGATLGDIAIQKSIRAGAVGIVLVMLFMSIYYKFPGFIAAQALLIYGVISMGVISGLNAVLTLPGIAGLILSLGMAVDANVIIFERIKEELWAGKTVRASIDAGFKRAWATILDSNITTLITALVLAYFTSGTVRGFAITLGIGILTSMFTAIVVTRTLMELQMKLINSPRAFGVRGGQVQ